MNWKHAGALLGTCYLWGLGGCADEQSLPPVPTEYLFSTAADTILLEESDGHVVGSITDLLQWRGNLVVVDGLSNDVKLYDPRSGQRTAVIGRTGQGPGEFISVFGAARLQDGGLAVLDGLLRRVTIFDDPEHIRTSWSLPGSFSGRIDVLPGGDLVLGGQIVVDREVVSDSSVHRFTVEGEYVRAYFTIPEVTRFPEGSLNRMRVAVFDSTVIGTQMITNEALVHDIRTGIDTFRVIEADFYRPIQWTLEPPVPDSEFEEWIQKQILVFDVRRLSPELLAIGFGKWEESIDGWVQRWTFRSFDGRMSESGWTEFHPAFVSDGQLYSLRIRFDGPTELIVGPAPI